MKNLLKWTVLFMVITGLMLVGCGKESTTEPEPESDREAIEWLVEENPSYFNTEDHYGEEDTTGGRMGTFSPIITYFWYRELFKDSIEIDITIDIIGDSAFVSWQGECDGVLHIFADTIFPPDSIIEYTKNFTDFGERYAIFKRLRPANEDPQHRRGWRLVKVSGAEITSDGNTVQIDSVRLKSEHYPDTLITDPLALFAKEDVVTLSPEEECSLTVYTNSDTLDHVFLHSWRKHTPHHRHPFHRMGNGIFEGVWYAPSNETGAMDVIHHVAFDMLSTGTLDDDTEPYDSNAWLFPYRVTTSR